MTTSRIRALLAVALLLLQALGPLAHHAYGHRDARCAGHAHCAPTPAAPDPATLHAPHACPTCSFLAHASGAMESGPKGSLIDGERHIADTPSLPSSPPRSADINISSARAPPR